VISATDVYQVHFASPNTTADQALAAAGLPAIGSAHPKFTSLKLSRLRPQQEGNGQRWVIDAEYSLPDQSEGGGLTPPPSGAERITFALSYWEEQVEWVADAQTGALLLNTADMPLTKGEMISVFHPMITVAVEYPSGRPAWSALAPLNGTVNQSSFTLLGVTVESRCGLLTLDIRDPNVGGYELVAQIRVRNKYVTYTDIQGNEHENENIGWDEVIQNRGLQELIVDEAGQRWVRIMLEPEEPNAEGAYVAQPATEPLPLDENGRVLNDGKVLSFRVAKYRSANWAALPFL